MSLIAKPNFVLAAIRPQAGLVKLVAIHLTHSLAVDHHRPSLVRWTPSAAPADAIVHDRPKNTDKEAN